MRSVEQAGTDLADDVFAFIRSLPIGNRTKEDIDRQLADERDSWGDR